MYTLYYSPGTASLVVHLALLELGVPYRLEKVDFDKGAQRSTEYLRLNPRGQVPTLVIEGKAYFESAALLMLLAERHPEARLAHAPAAPCVPTGSSGSRSSPTRSVPRIGCGSIRPTSAPKSIRRRSVKRCARASRAPGLSSMHTCNRTGRTCSARISRAWTCSPPCTCAGRGTCRARRSSWPSLRRLADLVRSRPSWRRMYEVEGLTEWAA